jgi:hypothetical protein
MIRPILSHFSDLTIQIKRQIKRLAITLLMVGTLVLSMSCASGLNHPGVSASTAPQTRDPQTRNPWLWPFAADSIWNLPIGDAARYKPAHLPAVAWAGVDVDLLFVIPNDSPLTPLYDPGDWENRCQGTTTYEHVSIPLPANLIVPDAVSDPANYYTPNNAAALLQPDGRTIIQLEPMARCVPGGPVYGYRWPKQNVDLYGDGIAGSHLGSGLSAIGGTIRQGELIGDAPIQHAIKIELWEKYLNYDRASQTPGYRWPADRADAKAASTYLGKNPNLVMGTLLAIPPKMTADRLGLKTIAGKKLFHALQDYGAYQVDVTSQSKYAIAVEQGVEEEFQDAYGYPMESDNNPYFQDVMKLVPALHVIINNQPQAIGGGGQPRVALAPPLTSP